ncbi:Defensin-like protein 281 [Arabidopsis thaliana]|uniref:Defensin-like protein 281 n=3 Tax=Arabidopsis TaxID=3701 RepID=DF281_ARATH|nr:Defensin-like (DEFL) family protein [Arabidopsis thaliana]Q2V4C3.1 RecName: Full=Defensin-like protein 281; Flags: Precursor [Arabidopsis thaliana]KAG7651994.1 hypothetical protein ISN45_At01g067900 [Arabidopsis thaliana x Arabidopsis arenosa]AEE35934.1 Defensin-like (DEFL) family protein [Arabidopsis thaliana]OAP12724.1 hypothetical protein AXX17_AT1G71610 [Arabidopsis thaliana]CAA0338978.1 unnamed protein product [Arabidopsis thaliana]VYS51282.1 unnamed protein product [Arabidopsis thali|eukprot:NP_001031290.1 Defensin-like (DEFL) family protein [Arabidopsis thaliana]
MASTKYLVLLFICLSVLLTPGLGTDPVPTPPGLHIPCGKGFTSKECNKYCTGVGYRRGYCAPDEEYPQISSCYCKWRI